MSKATPIPPVEWHITVEKDSHHARARLCEVLQPVLTHRLTAAPEASEFTWETPIARVHLRRQGQSIPGAPVRLAFAPEEATPLRGTDLPPARGPEVPIQVFPDPTVAELGHRLVGLEDIHESVLQHLRCREPGVVAAWSARTGQAIPPGMHAYISQAPALFIFSGDPGTGKTASPPVIIDQFCRELGVRGHLIRHGTEVRGNGHVGDFGHQIRAAFAHLARLPEDDVKALSFEEAEAVGMRRSEGQAHHEDRAGTASLLQALDTCGRLKRTVIFCTTNVPEALDAALIRRGTVYTFARPNAEARRTLLADWLPGFPAEVLDEAAEASEGMTGSDLARTLTALFTAAVQADHSIEQDHLLDALTAAPRTGRV
jgi:hypothetical protein